ncbi:MAG: esterase-like activity of phytase family protein [Mycobacterium sp.]
MILRSLLLSCCLLVASCGAPDATAVGLAYLGQFRVSPGATLDGTVIGGLSGISYDRPSNRYFVISDDRSARNPARFYTVQVSLSDNGIRDLEFTSTHPLLTRDGKPFGALDTNIRPPVVPPDSEGIAVDSRRQRFYWSSEGERLTDAPGGPVLLDPWIRVAGLDGSYQGQFSLPPVLKMSAAQRGPRQNHGLEGLALTPDGSALWAAMEGPGYDDGEPPTEAHGALTRITRFDVDTGEPTAQYAYPVDKVSAGPGGDNGLTDLVALNDDDFLVLERGYGTHVAARVYRAEIGDADDVSAQPSLNTAPVKPMTKTLLADLTTTPSLSPVDNIEGITLGPTLPDGRQSVVMVSDDNFSPRQITQFLAFAI